MKEDIKKAYLPNSEKTKAEPRMGKCLESEMLGQRRRAEGGAVGPRLKVRFSPSLLQAATGTSDVSRRRKPQVQL